MNPLDAKTFLPVDPTSTDQSSFAQSNKQALAIVPDTIEISFINLGGGVDFRQQSSASRPLLNKYLHTERMAAERAIIESNESEEIALYEKFFANQSPWIQERLAANRQLRKDPSLTAYDEFLRGAAKFYVWLNHANPAATPGSVTDVENHQNATLAYVELRTMIHENQAVIGDTQIFLTSKGANWPHFDECVHLLSEYRELNEDLTTLVEQYKEGKLDEDQWKKQLGGLGEKFSALEGQLDKIKNYE